MIHRIEIAVRRGLPDARGEHAAGRVRDFLHLPVSSVRTRDVYHLEAEVEADEVERIVREFSDPVLQLGAVGRLADESCDVVISVAYKPGVTDPIGKSALVAIEDILGRSLGEGAAVYTSVVYLLTGVDLEQGDAIARDLLANEVIQQCEVMTSQDWHASEPSLRVPKVEGGPRPAVRTIDLSGSDEQLEQLSRDGLLALSLGEMTTIRDHFAATDENPRRRAAGLPAAPTDVELECLAQTWSEHCKHKIFNATIDYHDGDQPAERIDSLFDTYIRGTTEEVRRQHIADLGDSWLVSVFHDNAGVVAFDDELHLVYKVETHNSPSALDPYGGAMTGIVGVNRDPFGTGRGAALLSNVWGYCLASPFYDRELPRGLLHPKRIRDGVHSGVIDGGNQSGIPYGRGWEIFDDRFVGKPLVFCGTVGALPVTIDGTPGEEKAALPGDAIVMVGGRIGADGIHGATFSSAALDEASPSQAVQIGDPITEKMMFDFLLEARDAGLYNAITDNGAGGLSSSVGEMAEGPGGARLDLERAPLKYAGLAPWEIFLSEAQERMTLAVPPAKLEALLALAARRDVEASVLGEFTDDGQLEVTWGEETVALLDMDFLHEGDPEMRLTARWIAPEFPEPPARATDHGRTLLDLVGRLNLASNERKARHYDHEVKGLTVVKPWVGVRTDVPAEGSVFLAHHASLRGYVLTEGINPNLSDLDCAAMAAGAVDEAVRRQLAAGARLDRIAALDNFCWPDPVQSAHTPDGEYKLAQLVRACRGLYDTCRAYGVPLVSGKDSMKNDAVMGGVKISVPPTLLVSAIGQIDDVQSAVTLDLKSPGDVLYVLGTTGAESGGSEYLRYLGERDGLVPELGAPAPYVGRQAPEVDTTSNLALYRAFSAALDAGLIRSAAVPARGGLGSALARAAMAGELGADLELADVPAVPDIATDDLLFAESNGRLLVTVAEPDCERFEALLAGQPLGRIGQVTAEPLLIARRGTESVFELAIAALKRGYQEALAHA